METKTKRLKVLLASNASTVLPSFQYIIRNAFKHDVVTASDPDDVFKQVEMGKKTKPFDLLITGAYMHSDPDYTGIVEQVRRIDPYVLCALYTEESAAAGLAREKGIRLDECILKKNGPHADLKPLFDRLAVAH